MADQIAYNPSENPGVSQGELLPWKGHFWKVINAGVVEESGQFAIMLVKDSETSNNKFWRAHGKRSTQTKRR